MRIWNVLLAAAAVIALVSATASARTLSGKVVAVDESSITVMDRDGGSTVYVLPPDLEIRTASGAEPVEADRLRGQRVTVTIEDGMAGDARRPSEAQPARVSAIRIDGDVEVDRETEIESDDDDIGDDDFEMQSETEIESDD